LDVADLTRHLRARLPDYMVPSAFVPLDAFPLTPSGKINRRVLPAPAIGSEDKESPGNAPRTDSECILAAIWAELLGVERVGINDNFFDLGGHSLLAAGVIDRANRELKTDLKLADLFRFPTVAGLLGNVAIRRTVTAPSPGGHLEMLRTGSGHHHVVLVGLTESLGWLPDQLPADVAAWWLRLDGLHGPPDTLRTIPEMAAAFAAEVQCAFSSGPLTLIGFSYGGLVAFELAQRLQEAGRLVHLVLLEPASDRLHTFVRASLVQRICSGMRTEGASKYWRREVASVLTGMWQRALRNYIRLRATFAGAFPERYRRWWYFRPQILDHVRRYVPVPYRGRVCLVGRTKWLNDYRTVWRSLIEGEMVQCEIASSGDHVDITKLPAGLIWLSSSFALSGGSEAR
jgi:pimeloyl-ACP methyl ester carboxylesterase